MKRDELPSERAERSLSIEDKKDRDTVGDNSNLITVCVDCGAHKFFENEGNLLSYSELLSRATSWMKHHKETSGSDHTVSYFSAPNFSFQEEDNPVKINSTAFLDLLSKVKEDKPKMYDKYVIKMLIAKGKTRYWARRHKITNRIIRYIKGELSRVTVTDPNLDKDKIKDKADELKTEAESGHGRTKREIIKTLRKNRESHKKKEKQFEKLYQYRLLEATEKAFFYGEEEDYENKNLLDSMKGILMDLDRL